ncbi:MAG: S-layer family protein, partial [Planctomycetes bacterium]|nr:S-layer family protein [Planctomycetota bacterium]
MSFGGAVSGLGDILVTAASAGLSGTTISATSLVGSVPLNGAVSITGQQNYTDRLVLATSGVNNISVAGVNTTTGPITLTTNLGTLTVGSLIATAGAVSLTHGGTLTIGGNIFAGTTLGVTTNNGASIVVGTGSNVSMQALGGGISLGGAVTLVNDLTVNASGAVAFGNTINSTAGQRRALSISTTNNSVTFSGAVGQVTRLGAISIAGTPTGINAGSNNISAASFVNTGASSGTINIQGIQNYDGALGLNLLTTGAGGNITLGQVTTTAGGVTLTNSNLLTLLGNISSFGTILQQAGVSGTPSLAIGVTSNGTILTIQTTNAGSAIDIGSATTLNQSATLIAAGNGSVDVRSTVNSNTTTARSLNISSTGGTITTGGAIGTGTSAALSLININAGAAGTINLNGGAITTSTSVGQIYTGSINLGNADLTLIANGTGVLTFNGNMNGTQNLTMTTSGAINFNGNVGANNPLGDIYITGANPSGFTITGTVNASSLQNLNSSFVNGNISIVNAQNYSVGGIVLESRNAGSITVGNITSGGTNSIVSFTHAGNLNLQGNINDSGTFVQNGTSGGTVFVGTTVPTTIQIGSGGAAFNRAVTLNRSLSLTAPGNITFGQNLNSAVGQTSNLTLNSSGILSFATNVGDTTALGVIDASTSSLTGITATNVNAVIRAQSFNSGFVAGNINLTTPQTYSTAAGLNLTTVVPGSGTSNITLGAVTTSNGGVVNIQNVDSLKLQGTLTLDGAFTQTNNDLSSTNEDVEFGAVSGISFSLTTTGDNISFEAPITMNQNSLLSTGATGLGVVTLSSSVDSLFNGAKNLTITNANGTANIGGSLGTANNAELGLLAITSNAINFTDNLNTTTVKTKGSSGQSYNGAVALNGDVVMNAGTTGPVSFSRTIDSAPLATKSLTLQGINAAQLNGNIGAINPLSSFSVSGTSSALTTFNAGSVTTIGSGQTYNTALLIGNTAPSQINLTAGSGDVVFGNTVSLTSRNLTVSADEIDINGTIDPSSSGVSVLVLQAGNTSTPVVIAGNPTLNTLDLTSAELLKLVNGFKSITIGNANSLGNLTVATALNSSEIRDPFTLITSGNMFINGAIAAVDNATLSLVDPNYATATINLASAISTQGNVITIDGATQVNAGGSIATTGTGNSYPLGANINLLANSGFTGTGTLTLDSGSVGLIVGNNSFNMSGGITITNSGGATFNQGVTAGAVNINATTSAKDVTFNGTLNATSLNTSNGAFNLKVLSGGNIIGATVLNNTGTTTLGDQATDALTFAGGLTATSSSLLNLAGTIATTNTAMNLGNAVLTTNTTLQSG